MGFIGEKSFGKKFLLLTVLIALATPASTVLANTISSSTLVFEGSLTSNADGTFSGTIPALAGTYYSESGSGCIDGQTPDGGECNGGFDVYAKEGGTAYYDDENQGTIGSDHDAYSSGGGWGSFYTPDVADYYNYQLTLASGRWYLEYKGDALGTPMSGTVDWANMYAYEEDVGSYRGTVPSDSDANDGDAGLNGGGAQAWDMDWTWGSEVIPLEYAGFRVTIVEDSNSDDYIVTLTPVAPQQVYVDDGGVCGDLSPCYTTIQEGIDEVATGGTVNVASGTYAESLTIDKEVSLIGESKEGVVIDGSGVDCGGQTAQVCITGNNVLVDSITIQDDSTGTVERGIKTYGNTGVSISNVKIEDISIQHDGWTSGTGIDVWDSPGLTIQNVELLNNGGAGIFIKSSDVTLDSITTSSNPWGGVGISTDLPESSSISVTGIQFTETNNFDEDVDVYFEQGEYGGEITFGTDPEAEVDVIMPSDLTDYVAYGYTQSPATYGTQNTYKLFFDSLTDASSAKTYPSGSYMTNLEGTEYFVVEGLSIQDAINQAESGDTINVATGTYEEDLTISSDKENLEIQGEEGAKIKGIATVDASEFPLAAPNIEILANGVSLHGFTIESPDFESGKYSSGVVIGAKSVEIFDNDFIVSSAQEIGEISQAIQTYSSSAMPSVDISGLDIYDNTFTHKGDGAGGYEAIYINPDNGVGTIYVTNNPIEGNVFRAFTTERPNVEITGNDIVTDLSPLIIDPLSPGAYQGLNILAAENILVRNNQISGSGEGKGFLQAINVGDSFNLDAEQNYWGSRNPDFETLISGDVDVSPWYETSSMTSLITPIGLAVEGTTITTSQDLTILQGEKAEFSVSVDYPEFNSELSEDWLVDAKITSNMNIPEGVEFEIYYNSNLVGSYTTPEGGVSQIWLSEALGLGRAILKNDKDATWSISISGLPRNDYTFTFESVSAKSGSFGTENERILSEDSINVNVHEHSEYAFTYSVPEPINEDEDYEIPVTLSASEIKDAGYDSVLILVEVDKPEGTNVDLMAYDGSNGYDLAETGYWGDPSGFSVSKDYAATTPVLTTFSDAGEYTITFKLQNLNTGQILAESNEIVSVADPDAPTTTISSDYEFGTWTNEDVTVSLSCDDGTGSGCANTYYKYAALTFQEYTGPVTTTMEGIHEFQYYSTDNYGNTETTQSAQIKIDKTPPALENVGFDYTAGSESGTFTYLGGNTYSILSNDDPNTTYVVNYNSSTLPGEQITEELQALHLVDSSMTAQELQNFFFNKMQEMNITDPALENLFTTYITGVSNGSLPFAYAQYNATSQEMNFYNGGAYWIGGEKQPWDFTGDLLGGNYTVQGNITDLAGNNNTVTHKFFIKKRSQYAANYQTPTVVNVNETYDTNLTLTTTNQRDEGYENASLLISVDKPEGANVDLNFTPAGTQTGDLAELGQTPGGPIPASGEQKMPIQAYFTKTGEYTINFTLINLNTGGTIAQTTTTMHAISQTPEQSTNAQITEQNRTITTNTSEGDPSVQINLTGNQTGTITVAEHQTQPNGTSVHALKPLNKYVEIVADQNIEQDMENTEIRVYYTDAEISAAGINEATLRLSYYNETSGAWEDYTAPNGGVNTTQNYVWAITNHFSLWAIFGDEPTTTTTTTTPPSGDVCVPEWDCTTWSECVNGTQTRACTETTDCWGATPPEQTQSCETPEEVVEQEVNETTTTQEETTTPETTEPTGQEEAAGDQVTGQAVGVDQTTGKAAAETEQPTIPTQYILLIVFIIGVIGVARIIQTR